MCPLWTYICVQTYGKYLGFWVGPGSTDHIWTKPLHKYLQRAKEWASLNLGMFFNLLAYKTFISSVLSFTMQLAEDPSTLLDYSMTALRLLLAGPGNWITIADASHLKSAFCFPIEFTPLQSLSLAIKARILATIAPDASIKARELEHALITYGRRTFPTWHQNCFFTTLDRCRSTLQEKDITSSTVKACMKHTGNLSFQNVARQMITSRYGVCYYSESRVRQKLVCWKLSGIPGLQERRIIGNMRLLADHAPPRV